MTLETNPLQRAISLMGEALVLLDDAREAIAAIHLQQALDRANRTAILKKPSREP